MHLTAAAGAALAATSMHPETLRNVGRAPVWRRRVYGHRKDLIFRRRGQVRAYGADDD
jgi:hypothetical protein